MHCDDDIKLPILSRDISKILIGEQEISRLVERLSREITENYQKIVLEKKEKLVLLSVLNGAVVFFVDLIRKLDLPFEITFIYASSYGATTVSAGDVEIKFGKNDTELKGAHVLVVEDILDSGNTLCKVMNKIKEMGALSVRLCTLLNKPDRRVAHVCVDFEGIVIPDEFVVGYGLDFAGKYRNLPYIGVLKPEIYSNI